jgi:hypothetical protein
VEWSDETQQKNLELIQSMTTDAVGKFLSHDYVSAKIDELSRQAGIELDNPEETVKLVGNQLKFTEEQIAGVFNHFIRGGQVTAGGVMQASRRAGLERRRQPRSRSASLSLRAALGSSGPRAAHRAHFCVQGLVVTGCDRGFHRRHCA